MTTAAVLVSRAPVIEITADQRQRLCEALWHDIREGSAHGLGFAFHVGAAHVWESLDWTPGTPAADETSYLLRVDEYVVAVRSGWMSDQERFVEFMRDEALNERELDHARDADARLAALRDLMARIDAAQVMA